MGKYFTEFEFAGRKERYVTGKIRVKRIRPMIRCDVNADIIAEAFCAVIDSVPEESSE